MNKEALLAGLMFGGDGGGSSGGGGVLVCTMDLDTLALDKTYAEILSAATSGKIVVWDSKDGGVYREYLTIVGQNPISQDYMVVFSEGTGNDAFITSSENGYPVLNEN